MLKKVLIANRGEIALRIIKACQLLNIKTVAVYSVADKDSLPALVADESYCIGPSQAKKSYLDIASILAAAKGAGADAIHPGYGFLAENEEFAKACVNAGLIFIGPGSEAIHRMGDKAEARKTMMGAGVPVVPGSKDLLSDVAEAQKVATEIGYPVLIKATAGGGGKGMRVVTGPEEMAKALRQSSQESERSFGNSGVYLEKYLEDSRHVEIQIMADNYGNVVYLGERDCSTQRRHQKLIEEAPSPVVDTGMRKKMGEAAVAAAKAVHYSGAGTVEFIVDKHNNFYFMEMNTRIQVEHPVTEMVTNTDLVKEQLLVASDHKLSWRQEEIKLKGWAIECRINAEDYQNNFMPCPGKIKAYLPPQGEAIRVDNCAFSGYTITPFYDSMIAKLIVWAPDRLSAIKKMQEALRRFKIEGIKTTIPFHLKLLNNLDFATGKVDTTYLEKNWDKIL